MPRKSFYRLTVLYVRDQKIELPAIKKPCRKSEQLSNKQLFWFIFAAENRIIIFCV